KIAKLSFLALALGALAVSDAKAWINSQFGIGLNWCYQSGGNNFFGPLWQNGQPPAPDCGIGVPGMPAPGIPAPCPHTRPNGGHPSHRHGATQGQPPPFAQATTPGLPQPTNRNSYFQPYRFTNYYSPASSYYGR